MHIGSGVQCMTLRGGCATCWGICTSRLTHGFDLHTFILFCTSQYAILARLVLLPTPFTPTKTMTYGLPLHSRINMLKDRMVDRMVDHQYLSQATVIVLKCRLTACATSNHSQEAANTRLPAQVTFRKGITCSLQPEPPARHLWSA